MPLENDAIVKFSEEQAAKIGLLYQKAEKDIMDKISRALLKNNDTTYLKNMLAGVQQVLADLKAESRTWSAATVPAIYGMAEKNVDDHLVRLGMGTVPQKAMSTLAAQGAIPALEDYTFSKLSDVTDVVGRRVNDIYRQMALEAHRGSVAGYDTWLEAAKRYKAKLADEGITGFTDKAGRQWNMTSYTEMVARTTTMETHLAGTANRIIENGHDLVTVIPHSGSCAKCQPWERKTLSLTGRTAGYPTLAMARQAGLFHPNCEHDVGAAIDLHGATEALAKKNAALLEDKAAKDAETALLRAAEEDGATAELMTAAEEGEMAEYTLGGEMTYEDFMRLAEADGEVLLGEIPGLDFRFAIDTTGCDYRITEKEFARRMAGADTWGEKFSSLRISARRVYSSDMLELKIAPELAAAPEPIISTIKAWDIEALGKTDIHGIIPGWEIEAGETVSSRSYGGVIVDDDGRFLIRKPTGEYDGYKWTWPKGKLKSATEDVAKAAMREVAEEAGYEVEIIGALPGKFPSGGGTTRMFLMRAVGPTEEIGWETEATDWVDAATAETKLSETTKITGRVRDRAILKAGDAERIKVLKPDYRPPVLTAPEEPATVVAEAAKTQPALPEFKDLTYDRDGSFMGGGGTKEIYVDAEGNEYLYKPALTKGGAPEPFRAYVQQGAADLAARFTDAGDYIQVRAVDLGGDQAGTYQRILKDVKELKTPIAKMAPTQIIDLQREHVLDWLVGNFDTSARNFIVKEDGTILGVDKEQAFRYLNDKGSQQMSMTYHPNKTYGVPEPIYNDLFRAFKDGKIKMDLQAIIPFLQRVEAIDTETYRAMFKDYAVRLAKTPKDAEAILDKIVARKTGLREEYRRFFTQIMKERDHAYVGPFKFADEVPTRVLNAKPGPATIIPDTTLRSLTVKTLRATAKDQGVKYFMDMTKDELVRALGGTHHDRDIVIAEVKERVTTRTSGIRLAKKAEKSDPVIRPKEPGAAAPARGTLTKTAPKVDPVVPSTPASFMKATKDNWKDSLDLMAKATNQTPQEVERKLNAKVQHLYGNAKCYSRIDGAALQKVLVDGKFKTQFETQTSHGCLSNGTRASFEKRFFGLPENLPPRQRPYYGFIAEDPKLASGKSVGPSHYGNCTVVFKDSMKSKATSCFGDSLGYTDEAIGGPVANPVYLMMTARSSGYSEAAAERVYKAVMNAKSIDELWASGSAMRNGDYSMSYIEAQYHGGIDMTDVDYVIVPPDQRSIGNTLERKGYKVFYRTS